MCTMITVLEDKQNRDGHHKPPDNKKIRTSRGENERKKLVVHKLCLRTSHRHSCVQFICTFVRRNTVCHFCEMVLGPARASGQRTDLVH